jgi:hypothetical protein
MNTVHINELRRRAHTAEKQFLVELCSLAQYALTLQTRLAMTKSETTSAWSKIDQARMSILQFRQRMNQTICGKAWRRFPESRPIFVPALEGTQEQYGGSKTLHWHVLLGNLPSRIDFEQLSALSRKSWGRTEAGVDDIVIKPLDTQHWAKWAGYMMKETRQGNIDCIDWEMAQLPERPVSTRPSS